MSSSTEARIAITALIALAVWIFICLPLLYLPGEATAHGEFLGVKYGEWLIFIATMALVWATWKLVKGADATAERQLRAYMFVRPVSTHFLYEGESCRLTITYAVRNSGQTPAHHLMQFGEIRNIMVPTTTAILTPEPEGPVSLMSLGPGDEIEGTVWGGNRRLDSQNIGN